VARAVLPATTGGEPLLPLSQRRQSASPPSSLPATTAGEPVRHPPAPPRHILSGRGAEEQGAPRVLPATAGGEPLLPLSQRRRPASPSSLPAASDPARDLLCSVEPTGRRELLPPNGLVPSSLSPAAGGEPLLPPSSTTGAQRWPRTASGHPPLQGAGRCRGSSSSVRRPRLLPGGAASFARDSLELPSSLKLHRRRPCPAPSLSRACPPGCWGAAKVRTVGPRGALSIPRDLEEAEASGRMAGAFPSPVGGSGGLRENGGGFPVPRCSHFSWKSLREKDGAGDGGDRCGWSYGMVGVHALWARIASGRLVGKCTLLGY
jgi:hypothetical protein